MSIYGGLSPDLHEILKDSRARNTDLGYDDATSAEDNVVSNLHEIIETRTRADHRILRRTSIDRRIGTNLDIVFENNPAKLGSRQKSGAGGGKSKSFLPNPRAGIDVHARSQYCVAQADMCADPAVAADDHAASDHRARPDPAAGADLRSRFNHTLWADFGGRIDHRTLSDNCGRVNSGRTRWDRMEQRCDSGPANVRFGCE